MTGNPSTYDELYATQQDTDGKAYVGEITFNYEGKEVEIRDPVMTKKDNKITIKGPMKNLFQRKEFVVDASARPVCCTFYNRKRQHLTNAFTSKEDNVGSIGSLRF